MKSFDYLIKNYKRLLIVPIVFMILITTSIAGVGYLDVTNNVINSDNAITFE